jgi:fatty acid-binding protein DegV
MKNGRISKRDGIIGSVFHVTPIMGDNGDGEIELKGKAIGWKAAVRKLVDMIGSYDIDFKTSIVAISHVNALEKAMTIKNEILARYSFKDILIFKAGGLSTAYADENGIILAFATR